MIIPIFQNQKQRLRELLYVTQLLLSGKAGIHLDSSSKFILLLTAPVDNVYLTFLHVKENSGLELSCKNYHFRLFTLKVLSFS